MKLKLSIILTLSILSFASFTENIKAEENIPSYSSFFYRGSVIIYGSKDSRGEYILANELKNKTKSMVTLTSDENISDEKLKNNNLVILSAANSNNILKFSTLSYIKSNFPVEFKDNLFIFGEKYYTNKKDAIIFRYPSPYNPRNYILVLYSNSQEGLKNLIRNSKLANFDYQIINSQGEISREGTFDKTNFRWTYKQENDNDINRIDPFSQNLKISSSPNFTYYYYPNSFASTKINDIKREYESYLKKLNLATATELDNKLNIYFYDSENQKKNLQTINSRIRNIHAVYNLENNEGIDALADYYYNQYVRFNEDEQTEKSFVVYATDIYRNNLDAKISKLYKNNKIPDLLSLLKKEISSPDEEIILGSFTKFLINKYGIENYKQIIDRAETLENSEVLANITPKLYTSFSRLEREWRYTLTDLARMYR